MATAQSCMRFVAERTGLSYGTVRYVARRLIENDIWPASHGASVPELKTEHVAKLLLVLLTDQEARWVASAAETYFDLQDEDGRTAGETLVGMIDSFRVLDNNPLSEISYKSQIEVGCETPYVKVVTDCIDGPLETLFLLKGTERRQWLDAKVRKSMTIPGKCLFDIANDMFRPKIVTVRGATHNGQPIHEWKQDAERELARMEKHLNTLCA